MTVQIGTTVLPAPQEYNEVVQYRAATHIGMDTRITRDINASWTNLEIYDIAMKWEELTDDERDDVQTAYDDLLDIMDQSGTLAFITPTGTTLQATLHEDQANLKILTYAGPKASLGGAFITLHDISLHLSCYVSGLGD